MKTKHIKIKYEPPHWKEVLNAIEEMRSEKNAPVDIMGCHLCDELDSEENKRFQLLVALVLSSVTRDQISYSAIKSLHRKLAPLSVDSMIETSSETIRECIKEVGFYNNKTEYLKQIAIILKNKYNGDIPKTVEELMELPGVGPKMAYLCMKNAWGKIIGIGVDVHVHRISNRLGWVKTKKPEQTRKELEGWLPREHWGNINKLFVGFGQQICKARNPGCEECKVRQWCAYYLCEM